MMRYFIVTLAQNGNFDSIPNFSKYLLLSKEYPKMSFDDDLVIKLNLQHKRVKLEGHNMIYGYVVSIVEVSKEDAEQSGLFIPSIESN